MKTSKIQIVSKTIFKNLENSKNSENFEKPSKTQIYETSSKNIENYFKKGLKIQNPLKIKRICEKLKTSKILRKLKIIEISKIKKKLLKFKKLQNNKKYSSFEKIKFKQCQNFEKS